LPDGSRVPTQELRRSGERRALLAAVPAPPLGWTTVRPSQVPVPGTGTGPGELPADLDVSTLTRIVRGRDVGDSYNYAPAPDDVLVDKPIDERLEGQEEGAMRRVLVLHRTYAWSDELAAARTRVELGAKASLDGIRTAS